MDNISDAHYFMLPTQGNIYSLAILNLCSGINKFIIASLKKKIFSFEYLENSGVLKPTVKEISCTYIPSGAEIMAVDAFNKSDTCDDFQIGIAITKLNAEGSPDTYLNIYSEQDLDSNYVLNLDSIAQNCLMVELNFIPYHLTHTFIVGQVGDTETREMVWLLSGGDGKVHVYQEDQVNHSYMEADLSELFPELVSTPSIVTWLSVQHTHQFSRRVSVIGCECGSVQLYLVNCQNNSILSSCSDVFDCPVSQVQLFSLYPSDSDVHPPDWLHHTNENKESSSQNSSKHDLHLLVCNTLEPSVVYMNVEDKGFSEKRSLIGSELHDSCLCAGVMDINMDGQNEILLGTYGQRILIYQYDEGSWLQTGQHRTANPVHSLHYVDLIGDGVCELVVQTLSGVHIMQHDPDHIYQVLMSRLKNILGKKNENPDSSDTTQEETHLETLLPRTEPLLDPDHCPCEEAREKSSEA